MGQRSDGDGGGDVDEVGGVAGDARSASGAGGMAGVLTLAEPGAYDVDWVADVHVGHLSLWVGNVEGPVGCGCERFLGCFAIVLRPA